MLNVQRVRPDADLYPYIHLFVQRSENLGCSELVEPVVARLGVTVEFKFAGLYQIRAYASNAWVRPNRISVVGPQTFRRVQLSFTGDIETLTVMFQPCGFHAFFGRPINSIADTSTEGHSLLGRNISHLYERLGNLQTFSERTKLLNGYFLRQLANLRGTDPVYGALQRLTTDRQFSIMDAARQAGLSRRQLERKSLVCAGMTPKDLACIARFGCALRLSRESSLNWTEIAHATEYHDHMHLVRDFHVYAGQAPSLTRREIASDHLINFSASFAVSAYANC